MDPERLFKTIEEQLREKGLLPPSEEEAERESELWVDPPRRVVRLNDVEPHRQDAVFEEGTLTICTEGAAEPVALPFFDPADYSDDELRRRLKTLLTFL